MDAVDVILQKWLEKVAADYPAEAFPQLAGEADRFCHPVGSLFRENLAILLQELLGTMEPARIDGALTAIMRVRAVQDLDAARAADFISRLQPVIFRAELDNAPADLQQRIEQVGRLAREEYDRCRQLLSVIRSNERRRSMAAVSARTQARPRPWP